MIGSLKGTLTDKSPPFLLLDVQGVGYELEAPMATFYELSEEGQEVLLFTHMVVREDAQLLYGFSDRAQRELFRSLLKVNGIGPRVALAILSTLSTTQFVQCVRQQDTLTLISVPGIGKKTAERMLLDMRDRLDGLGDLSGTAGKAVAGAIEVQQTPVDDAIGALIALGYKAGDANQAVRTVEEQSAARDDLIRNALQFLSRH